MKGFIKQEWLVRYYHEGLLRIYIELLYLKIRIWYEKQIQQQPAM